MADRLGSQNYNTDGRTVDQPTSYPFGPDGEGIEDHDNIMNFDSGFSTRDTVIADTAGEGANHPIRDADPAQNDVVALSRPRATGLDAIMHQLQYTFPGLEIAPMMSDATSAYVESTTPVSVRIPDGTIAVLMRISNAVAIFASWTGNPAAPAATIGAQAQGSFLAGNKWYFCYGKQEISFLAAAAVTGFVSLEFYKQSN